MSISERVLVVCCCLLPVGFVLAVQLWPKLLRMRVELRTEATVRVRSRATPRGEGGAHTRWRARLAELAGGGKGTAAAPGFALLACVRRAPRPAAIARRTRPSTGGEAQRLAAPPTDTPVAVTGVLLC
jgi:hypothetical protein